MAADFFAKERALIALTTTGASIATGSGAAAGTDLDCRTGGNAAEDFQAIFELVVQWVTITSIAVNVTVADLYLVPKVDGSNLPDVDLTAGTSALPNGTWAGSFVCAKAPSANTNMRFVTGTINLNPLKYTAHIINRSGQTMTVNWTLNAVTWRAQSA